MSKLNVSPDLKLTEDAFYQPWGILAMRGAGKTNAAAVMAEELHKAGHAFVVVDPVGSWWGLRASREGRPGGGLPIPIFGGDHADVPLEETGGEVIADFLVDERASCVIDASALSESAKHRFLTVFTERLFRRNSEPLVVFLEEADDYAPQRPGKGPALATLGAMQRLVKRGRFKGLTPVMVTQRSAAINKDLLTQIENLVVLRTTSPQDRKAIQGWVEYHGQSREILESLGGLEDGEAWLWSPHALKTLERFRFRLRDTFDSGATPKGGARRRAATLADVDLGALKDRMASTIERAKQEDPKELRRQMAQLRRELKQRPVEKAVERVEVPIEIPVLTDEQVRRLESVVTSLNAAGDQFKSEADDLRAELRRWKQTPVPVRPAPRTAAVARPAPASRPRREPAEGDEHVKAGARRILETLARHYPMKVTKAQLGTLARFKVTGGTFMTYYSQLKRLGYIEENGKLIAITDDGLAFGEIPQEPMSTEELVEQWRSALKAGARAMLDILVELQGEGITRDELAERVDMEVTGGTFNTYLRTLRRNGLAEVSGGVVRASDALFLGVGA